MRVLYDISTIGNTAGLGRWVRELALEFPRHDACHVTFCAPGSLYGVVEAAEFLREHPDFDASGVGRLRLAQRMVDLAARWTHNTAGGPRAARRVAGLAWQLVMRGVNIVANDIPAQALRAADIFNSPFGRFTGQTRRDGLKRFLTIHDLMPEIMPECFTRSQRSVHRRILASIGPDDHVICVSESTRRDLCRLTPVRPEQTSVIYPGSNSERFHPCPDPAVRASVRGKYGVPPGPFLLSVATLEPRKNLPFLVRAFAAWVRETRNHELNLVLVGGRGWNYESLLTTVDGLAELRDRVYFAGFVEDTDLAPLYCDALAFVYPSLYEGFGSPVAEALKCGCAIITSRISSLPEVVGDAGLLIDPHDETSLCQALDTIWRDASMREQLSQRALARATQFSWSRCVEEHLTEFRKAIGRG